MRIIAIKTMFSIFFLVGVALIPALGQGTEDVNVWNVYCNGDTTKCAIAKEPSGELTFPQFPGKVDWDTAQNWMNAWRPLNQPKVWNVYCNGNSSTCVIAKEPSGELTFPQFTQKVDWETAQNWLNSWRAQNQPKVWNVYCNGNSSKCTIAKEPSGELSFPQFPGKVDWQTAQDWLASWKGNSTTEAMPIGSGTSHTYKGIPFQVDGVALKANSRKTMDSIDLAGKKAKVVHILDFAGWSTNVPTNTKVGQIKVYYQDGSYDSTDLAMGVNIAEWAYDRPEVQSLIKHNKVEAAFSWPGDGTPSSSFQGHLFYAKVNTDPNKPLDRLELVLESIEQKIQIEIKAITLQ
jgi:hypothetical protein